jgi:hypothetical protein
MQKRKRKITPLGASHEDGGVISTPARPDNEKAVAVQDNSTALSVGGSNAWIEIASELDRFVGAAYLKFNKQGEYAVSDTDVVPNGTRCIAHVDEAAFGWRKWEGGRPVDERMGRVADCFVPPQRQELGDTDQTKWETGDEGERRDPWQFCASVPFTRLDTGESYLFAVSSKGGLRCVNGLIRSYGNRVRQKGKDVGLPVIELQPGHYKHRTYGKIYFPDPKVVSWTDESGNPLSLKDDMEDDLPDFGGRAA